MSTTAIDNETAWTAAASHGRRSSVRAATIGVAVGVAVGLPAGLFGAGMHAAAVVGPVLGVFGVLVAVTDVRERRIPDRLVAAAAVAAVVVALAVELVDGRQPGFNMVLGSAVAGLPLLVVHVVLPAGVGFGDVKFAVVVGALLGAISPGLGGLAVATACLVAVAGAVLLWWPRSSIPFGACLAVTSLGGLAAGHWWAT